jgi:putative sigma-54 modulation protein
MNIRTESVHFTADQKLLDFIDKKIGRLEQYYDKIMDADVYLKLENGGQIKDKIVEVKLRVPGDSIFIKETSKTFETAIDGAADRLKRQLIKFKELQRGH